MVIALFDVDGTLMLGSKLKDEIAYPMAFREVYGLDVNIDDISRKGKTDQEIIVGLLKKKGLSNKEITSKLKVFMDKMVEVFNQNIEDDEFDVFKEVPGFLSKLSEKGVIMGLVTGNLEPIAWGALEKVGLKHYFKFGGFGTDDGDRSNLIRVALDRAKGLGLQSEKVFLFGDAPQDMRAGKARGVVAVGVTTGAYSKEDLLAAGADHVFENLGDEKLVRIVTESK